MEPQKSNTTTTVQNFLWLIVAILLFACLGALIAKVQYIYNNGYNVLPISQWWGNVVPTTQQENNSMFTYALIGGALGLIVGLFNATSRRQR